VGGGSRQRKGEEKKRKKEGEKYRDHGNSVDRKKGGDSQGKGPGLERRGGKKKKRTQRRRAS